MASRAQDARNKLGNICRHHRNNPELVNDARRNLAAAKINDYIEKVLETAPPLTAEQRTKLAELLRPARSGVSL